MRIIFFGSDYYSTIALSRLLENPQHQIVMAVTGSQKATYPFEYLSVSEICEKNSIPVIQIHDKSDFDKLPESLNLSRVEIGLSASFGFLIPPSVFGFPQHQTLNIHPSLLPQYRGVSPLQQAILDGQVETGVSLMRINEKFDAGEILLQEQIAIEPNETTLSLGKKCFTQGVNLFLEIINNFPGGNFPMKTQIESDCMSTKGFSVDDAYIDFSETNIMIDRKVRAFYPKPIAWTYLANLVKKYQQTQREIPSKWQKTRVKLYAGYLSNQGYSITALQIEGKSKISWKQFSDGYLK